MVEPGEGSLANADGVIDIDVLRDRRGGGQPTRSLRQHLLNLNTIEFGVSPFQSFRDVGRFQKTLAGISSVRDLQPRGLQRGSLQLRVECSSVDDLLESLRAQWTQPFEVISHEPHRIEIRLEAVATDRVQQVQS